MPTKNSHHTAGVANPLQFGGDVFPHTDAPLPNTLACSQLHKEQGNSHNQ